MALQTSGAISLNDIHVEAGGSSGTAASINDSDIRGLISKGSGAQMSFNEWYGASNVLLDTATTLQRRTTSDEYGNATTEVIYSDIPGYGSMTDNTWTHPTYGTVIASVLQIDWGSHSSGSTPSACTIRFYYRAGTNQQQNGGFSKIEFASSGRNFTLNRTSASYSPSGQQTSTFTWTGQSITYASSSVSGTFKIYP
jgi:hypothetical protein